MSEFLFYSIPRFAVTAPRRTWFANYVAKLGRTHLDEIWLETTGAGIADHDISPTEAVVNLILAFCSAGEDGSDSSCCIPHGLDYAINITGGLSSGDTPTTAAENYELLQALPEECLLKFIEWAREDMPAPPHGGRLLRNATELLEAAETVLDDADEVGYTGPEVIGSDSAIKDTEGKLWYANYWRLHVAIEAARGRTPPQPVL